MMDLSLWMVVGIGAVLFMTLLLNRHQRGVSPGMYRAYFIVGGCGLFAVALLPNLWLQGLFGWLLVTALRDRMLGAHLPRLAPMIACLLLGALLLPSLSKEQVVPMLGLIVTGGVILTLQAMRDGWARWKRKGSITLHAFQENVNNAQAIAVVCTSAACGLAWMQSAWWLVAACVAGFPIWFTVWKDWRRERSVTMGPVLLAGVGLMALPLVIGWWALWLLPFVLIGLAFAVMQALRLEKWWDSGRIRCWYTMLLMGWWLNGWGTRLCGRGWQSWVSYNDFIIDVARKTNRQHIVNTRFMMSTAHNEFVQMLFEQGAVGLLCLVGYVLTALWQLGHGDAAAQAVYITAVGMCGAACTLHPWTWTHGTLSEVDEKGNPVKDGGGMKLYTIGSPALNWLAFMIAVLVEVAR